MWDVNAKEMVEIPDEKIRQDAALAILAYNWGTPVSRSIAAHGDVSDFPDLLRRLQNSPAAQALEDSEQKTVEGKEITPALPVAPIRISKSVRYSVIFTNMSILALSNC
jgi:hypothetical protein